jgi:hypothetical protein
MMRIHRAAALALALGLSSLPLATPALAAPAGNAAEADGHYKRGVELYKEADYRAALIEFRRAYELLPAYQALYNIAETSYQLQDYAGALKAFEQYLADGGGQIAADRRAEVEKDIGKLRLRVAKIEISAPVADVEISIDDVVVGKTPLSQPVMVSAGRRKVVAVKAGRPPVTRVIDVAGGDSIKLPIDLPAEGAPPPARVEGAPVEPLPARSAPIWPWIGTGVLAGGAVVTGVLALGASNDLKDKINTLGARPDDITSAHGKTATLALTTDILTGAAIVLGGVSLYLTLSSGPKSDRPEKGDKAAPAPVLRVGATPGGIRVFGSF